MYVTSRLVLLALLAALLFGASEGAVMQLPKEVYVHMTGGWNVEASSSCKPLRIGAVTVANDTADLQWSGETSPIVIGYGDSDATYTLDGIQDLLTTGSDRLHYRICEVQKNELATPGRPLYENRMASTHLVEYSGIVSSARDGNDCDSTSRNIIIRTIGMSISAEDTTKWRQNESIQQIEIIIYTQSLPWTCFSSHTTLGRDTDVKRAKRRRGVRNPATSEAADSFASSGATTLRFIRVSPPTRSFFERYYTSLTFIGIFILYRVVYGYFSHRASK